MGMSEAENARVDSDSTNNKVALFIITSFQKESKIKKNQKSKSKPLKSNSFYGDRGLRPP
jgi:hypothetical protein